MEYKHKTLSIKIDDCHVVWQQKEDGFHRIYLEKGGKEVASGEWVPFQRVAQCGYCFAATNYHHGVLPDGIFQIQQYNNIAGEWTRWQPEKG